MPKTKVLNPASFWWGSLFILASMLVVAPVYQNGYCTKGKGCACNSKLHLKGNVP